MIRLSVNGIEYARFMERDAEEMIRLLGQAFAQRDPPAVAAGLTALEFEEFVRLLCTNPSMRRLTIVARSVDGGEMAGALLAEDSSSPLPAGMERLSPKFAPIFDLLGQLESGDRTGHVVSEGESAHLFLLGVADRYCGRGIAQQLVAQCAANAIREGYRRAVTEATNRTSQHIFRSCGFVERARVPYEEHRYEGKAHFASIAEQGGPILMERLLIP